MLTRGDEARDQKNWRGAAEAYRTALDRRPELTDIWVQYGHALKEAGQTEEAVAAYRRALEQRPDDAETYVHLAHLLKRLKRRADAIAAFEKASALTPDDASLREELRLLKAPPPSDGRRGDEGPASNAARDALFRERNAALAEAARLKAERSEWDRSSAARVREAEERLDHAQDAAERLRNQLTEQKAALAAHTSEIGALKAQLSEARAARDALFRERNAAREEVSALKPLKDQLAEMTAAQEALAAEMTAAQEALAAERDAALAEAADLKARAGEWERSATARQAAAQALYEEAQGENELFKEQIAGQQAELEAQQDALSAHASEAGELKAQLSEAKAARDALFRERNAAREEASALKPLKDRLAEMAAAQEALAAERDAALAEAADLKARAGEWERSATARQAAAQALYEEAQGENELFKEQIAGQQAELAAKQTEAEALAARLAEAEAARDGAMAEAGALKPLEEELSKVKSEREGLFQERNAARDELAAKQTEAEALAARLAEAEAARDGAMAEAETARKTARDFEVRVGMAREEFLRSEGQIALIKDLVLREDGL